LNRSEDNEADSGLYSRIIRKKSTEFTRKKIYISERTEGMMIGKKHGKL
jgi:hypothetical protein